MTRRITVLVGTDHHDFSRVVRWADAWQHAHPGDDVLVQHGFSPAPAVARGVELIPPTDLVGLVTGADVVVTHGGPGTIMSARHAGHRPLAVPRDPSLGEHVDGHQMRFVAWAAAKGLCQETVSVEELSKAVAALGPAGTRSDTAGDTDTAVEVHRLEQAVSGRRRHRRDASPSAVPVLYRPGAGWHPREMPESADVDPVVVLGSVAQLWLRGPGVCCSCGLAAGDCAFWTEVTERAFGGWDNDDLAEARSRHLAVRARGLRVGRHHPGAALRRELLGLALPYRRVVSAALEATGARTAVDHGGPVADALPLSHCREIDLRVLRPRSPRPGDLPAWVALRYRGVPLLAAPAVGDAAPDCRPERQHQLKWDVRA